MKAVLLSKTRIAYTDSSFAEIVVWDAPKPFQGSTHSYKYRLTFVVEGVCVLRYDNEFGKGDHTGDKAGLLALRAHRESRIISVTAFVS